MKSLLLLGVLVSACSVLGANFVHGQNFTQMIAEKYTDTLANELLNFPDSEGRSFQSVYVGYESPTTVLLYGALNLAGQFEVNKDLWNVTDMLRNEYGFKIQEIFTTGEDIVNILLIK